ncbi:MAG: nuclear transport factor 2 family protein [Solirubrobacterales bacterium]
MSQENVEMARRVFDALNRGDLPDAMEDAATDFTFDFSRSRSFERGVYGRDEVAGLQEALVGVWESMHWDATEFIERGDEVITPITTHQRGRQGIEVQTTVAWLWSFRDGRIARITFFQSREEALEAAGLSE